MAQKTVRNSISSALIMACALTAGTERVNADAKEAAALLILGCTLFCKGNKGGGGGKVSPKRPGISAAQRQQNRDVQSSLNAFGFPVGTVDGSLGRKSRAAISNYQAYMGYPATGQLTDFERQTLVGSWQRFNAGEGARYPQMMAAVGPRGMLNTTRDPNYPAQFGDAVGPYYAQPAPQPPVNPNLQAAVPQPVPVQPTVPVAVTPAPVEKAGGEIINNVLPTLKPIGVVTASAAARCELVDQTTRIQGGVISAVNMTDPNQAMSEKFCEARGFAITQGQTISAGFAVSEEELKGFCEDVKAACKAPISTLPVTSRDQAIEAAKATAQSIGIGDPASAGTYGQICLGMGYRLDDAEMALSGAMAMLAAGNAPYGEIVGHHLREGFGVQSSAEASVSWYSNAMNALESGVTPVFVPSATNERIQVIRASLELESQRAAAQDQASQIIPTSNRLPVLKPAQ